jgi:hypothetical protein
MKKLIGLCIVAALVSAGAAVAAKKDADAKAPPVLAEADRAVPSGRLVLSNLYQREIETSVFVDPIARTPYNDGYWYGGWGWIRAIENDNQDVIAARLIATAERNAVPVRAALSDFDTDALALATTKAALAKPDWFQARDVTGSSDVFAISKADFLAQNAAAQIAFVRYRYDLSPDFTQIRVLAMLSIERQPLDKNGKPAGNPVAIYRQNIMSIAQMRAPSYEARDNAKRWAADNGKLAKVALTTAFGQFERLIPLALGLSQTQMTAFNDKKSAKAFSGGYYGALIARDADQPDAVLIWKNGLVHVQPVG